MQALFDELKHPIYQSLSDQQAADMVNAKTVTIRQLVKVADLKTFAMKEGFYPDIVIDAQSATDIKKRKLCLALWLWIDDPSGRIEHADLDLPKAKELLSGLVDYGYITLQQRAGIEALAVSTIPWVDHHQLGIVGVGAIYNARREMNNAQ